VTLPLRPELADALEELLLSEAYGTITQVYEDRIADMTRKVMAGRLSHDDYLAACAAVREAQYLRDRPKQLIQEARMTQ
jgi:hypothetical protein